MHYFHQSCKTKATDLSSRERAEIDFCCRLAGFMRLKIHNHVTDFAHWVAVMMRTLITEQTHRADAHFTTFDERVEVAKDAAGKVQKQVNSRH